MMTPIDIMYREVGGGDPELVVVVTERMLRHRVSDLDEQLLDDDDPARHLSDIVRKRFAGASRWASSWDNNDGGYFVGSTEWAELVAELLA